MIRFCYDSYDFLSAAVSPDPSYTLHVNGSAGLTSGTSWQVASDLRLKDIDGDYGYGLEEIRRLRTVRFHYRKDNPLNLPNDLDMIGFVAQEVRDVIPEAVRQRPDGYLELNVDPIHWAMVNGLKDLAAEKDAQIIELQAQTIKLQERADRAEADAERLKAETARIRAEKDAEIQALKIALCGKWPDLSFCSP